MIKGAAPSKRSIAPDCLIELCSDYCQGVRNIVAVFVELGCREAMLWGSVQEDYPFWMIQWFLNKVPSLAIFIDQFRILNRDCKGAWVSRYLLWLDLEGEPSPFGTGNFVTIILLFLP